MKIAEKLIRTLNGKRFMRKTIEVEVPEGTSLLDAETTLQAALMKAGSAMLSEFLSGCDTDGKPLEFRGRRLTAKQQKEPLVVESTFGAITVMRWAYQGSGGGTCHYPLDRKMELLGSATPKFARSVNFKHAHAPAAKVCQDLAENHERVISVHFVQNITALLGEMALVTHPQPDTELMPPPAEVATIAVGIDGACLQITVAPEAPEAPEASEASQANASQGSAPMAKQDRRKGRSQEWRVAMVGTIAFYDQEGNRHGTMYTGCAPPEQSEDGKEDFWFLMERDLAVIKARYPAAKYIGISDGARDFVPWLQKHTDVLMLDFWHAAGYLSGAAAKMVAGGAGQKKRALIWLEKACHELKHEVGAAARLLDEMKTRLEEAERKERKEGATAALHKAVTYFGNNLTRMDYAARVQAHEPIGSGVTESACGLIIKDRLCGPGMRWTVTMAQHMITLRSMISTTANCWQNFWKTNFAKAVT